MQLLVLDNQRIVSSEIYDFVPFCPDFVPDIIAQIVLNQYFATTCLWPNRSIIRHLHNRQFLPVGHLAPFDVPAILLSVVDWQ